MVIVSEVKLPKEIFDKLKELHYKDRQFKDMLQEQYNKDLFEASIPVSIEYNDFKTKITNEYIPTEFQQDRYTWNADFYSEKLYIQDSMQ